MPNPKDHPLLLTVPQTAELLQIGRETAYQLTHREDFPAIRIGRSVRINREGLQPGGLHRPGHRQGPQGRSFAGPG